MSRRAVVRQAILIHKTAQKQWKRPTDCERLDAAFDAISKGPFIACHNTSVDDVREDVLLRKDSSKQFAVTYYLHHPEDMDEDDESYAARNSTDIRSLVGEAYEWPSDSTGCWNRRTRLKVSVAEIRVGHSEKEKLSAIETVMKHLNDAGLATEWEKDLRRPIRIVMKWQFVIPDDF